MASTNGSSLHGGTAHDLEKNTHAAGAPNAGQSYSSEGGAPLNLRNITPGGHPLDRVRPAPASSHCRGVHLLTPLRRIDDAHRASLRSPSITASLRTRRRLASAVSP